MAGSLSHAKLLAASLVDALSPAITRRGYAAAAATATQGGVSGSVGRGGGGGSRSGMVGKVEERGVIKEETGEGSSSWVPDPVTGDYKPGNRSAEVDAAELRDTVLNHKIMPH